MGVGGAGTVNHSRKVSTHLAERDMYSCLWFIGSISDVLSWDYGLLALLYERSQVVLLLSHSLYLTLSLLL